MEPCNSWFSRVHENGVLANLPRDSGNDVIELNTYIKRKETSNILSSKNGSELVLRGGFSEDYELEKSRILDPRGESISRWRKIFLAASIVSLFVDPMFFHLPIFREDLCVENGRTLQVILTIIRSVADIFYVIQIFVRFNTGYDPPSSLVLTRGDQLIIGHSKVALRYIRRGFWIDILAALPLPQVLVWVIIPNVRGALVSVKKIALWHIMIIQYLLRVFLIYPLSCQIIDATGVIQETAWAGAAYNLMLYMLASHVSRNKHIPSFEDAAFGTYVSWKLGMC